VSFKLFSSCHALGGAAGANDAGAEYRDDFVNQAAALSMIAWSTLPKDLNLYKRLSISRIV
jgi:hypothetical protein